MGQTVITEAYPMRLKARLCTQLASEHPNWLDRDIRKKASKLMRKELRKQGKKKRHRKTRKRKQQELAREYGIDRPMHEIKAKVAERNPNMPVKKVNKEARRIHKATASHKLCQHCKKNKAKRGKLWCGPCGTATSGESRCKHNQKNKQRRERGLHQHRPPATESKQNKEFHDRVRKLTGWISTEYPHWTNFAIRQEAERIANKGYKATVNWRDHIRETAAVAG